MTEDYHQKYTVSSVAKLFNVEANTIKKWTRNFPEYMTITGNPLKGVQRIFSIEDIRVMAYIYYYCEDEQDILCIKMGLNSNSHYDNEPIDNLILRISPFIFEYHEK